MRTAGIRGHGSICPGCEATWLYNFSGSALVRAEIDSLLGSCCSSRLATFWVEYAGAMAMDCLSLPQALVAFFRQTDGVGNRRCLLPRKVVAKRICQATKAPD